MVTLSIHQMKRGETKMDLWSVSDLKQPVHSFIGLNDSVYDFAVGKIPGKGLLFAYMNSYTRVFLGCSFITCCL